MGAAGVLRRTQVLVRAAALLVLLASITVLAGWALDIPWLQSVLPGGTKMVPATALAFALAAVSLWFATDPGNRTQAQLSRILAALTATIGLLKLADLILPLDWHFDFLGFAESPGSDMAPATALNFALIGAALILATTPRFPRLYQALTLLVLLVGWLGFSRHVYGGEPLVPYARMAIHTAFLFLVLSVATLFVRRDAGFMALLVRRSAGGASARLLLPAAVILPLVIGLLPLYANRQGWVGAESELSLFALCGVVIFATLVWVNARSLDHTDRERLQAQDDLRATEERTRLIIETALDAVITIDRAGVITGWSANAESTFGWNRTEAVGRLLSETIIPERLRAAHREGLRRYLETRAARVLNRRIELSALHRDGREFPVELAITPIRERGEIAFSAFVRDITERVGAETALRESEARFRRMADGAPVLIWISGTDKLYTWFNRQWLEFVGRPLEQELGNGWADNVHPQDLERCIKTYATAFDARETFSMEYRLLRHDGEWRWVLDQGVPLYEAESEFIGYIGSCIDVTETRQAMDAIRASEAKLRTQNARLNLLDRTTRAIGEREDLSSIFQVVVRSLEDQLPVDFCCICLYDPVRETLTVTCVGTGSQSLAQELAMPQEAHIRVDPNGLSRCVHGQLVYEPDISQSQFPFPRRLAGAQLRSVVFAPLVVENSVFGIVIAARREPDSFQSSDCEFLRQLSEHVALASHQAQLYVALQRAYDDLRQTQQSVMQQERLRAFGQMASGVAHDINNALSPAALYIESLLERDPSLSGQARDNLVVIQRAIDDVTNTVARMRDFYRPRETQLALVPVRLNHCIGDIIELTRARWSDMPEERGTVIELEADLAPALPNVMGAENEIRDALTNLVLNAVDAMPQGGTLTLRTRAVPGMATGRRGASAFTHVHVEICDTGVGMTDEVRSHCIEPFFTTKGERGTGLGLAMVYGMVKRHDGEFEIESAPDKGTTIRLIFPILADDSGGSRPLRALRPVQRLRILIVDDDPLLLRSLRDALEGDGHAVSIADGGQAGIDAFVSAETRGERFAAVITDLGMPYVDGRRVASAIKTAAPATPVILLTGWGHRMRAENDVPENVDRVLSKPPKLLDLRQTLAELIEPADAGTRDRNDRWP